MARAYVHPPAEFQDAPESEGNDVYLCEYEYDDAWKRFRKRRYGENGPDDISGANASCPMTPAGAGTQCQAGCQLHASLSTVQLPAAVFSQKGTAAHDEMPLLSCANFPVFVYATCCFLCVCMVATGLRLTPSKGKGAAAAAGASGGRRLFGAGSDSDSDGEYSSSSDDDDANYRPDPHHLSGRGKGSVLSKRKRHGQLPGTAADKVSYVPMISARF